MKYKKLTSMALVAALSFTCVGCGNQEKNEDAKVNQSTTNQKVEGLEVVDQFFAKLKKGDDQFLKLLASKDAVKEEYQDEVEEVRYYFKDMKKEDKEFLAFLLKDFTYSFENIDEVKEHMNNKEDVSLYVKVENKNWDMYASFMGFKYMSEHGPYETGDANPEDHKGVDDENLLAFLKTIEKDIPLSKQELEIELLPLKDGGYGISVDELLDSLMIEMVFEERLEAIDCDISRGLIQKRTHDLTPIQQSIQKLMDEYNTMVDNNAFDFNKIENMIQTIEANYTELDGWDSIKEDMEWYASLKDKTKVNEYLKQCGKIQYFAFDVYNPYGDDFEQVCFYSLARGFNEGDQEFASSFLFSSELSDDSFYVGVAAQQIFLPLEHAYDALSYELDD